MNAVFARLFARGARIVRTASLPRKATTARKPNAPLCNHYEAGDQITTGSSNIDIGNVGFVTDTNLIRIGSGQNQTFIAGVIHGNGTGLTNLNAAQLTSFGSANGNFFVGPSGNATTSGDYNTGDGYDSLGVNAGGSDNTAIGGDALSPTRAALKTPPLALMRFSANTGGYGNTALGFDARSSKRAAITTPPLAMRCFKTTRAAPTTRPMATRRLN